MQGGEINKLIEKYLNGTATASETKQVDDWYAAFENQQSLTSQLSKKEIDEMVTKSFRSMLSSAKFNA